MTNLSKETLDALSSPFAADRISWKPQITTKNEGGQKKMIMKDGRRVAGCIAYIDARDVMNRLDEIVGGEWGDSYKLLDPKHVECTLTICGVSRADVGEYNEGGTADHMKSLYSDSFKRAAVKFGIGRHLYEEEIRWLPFDGYKVDTSGIVSTVETHEPTEDELNEIANNIKVNFHSAGKNMIMAYGTLKKEYAWLTFDHVKDLWASLTEVSNVRIL